VKGTRSLPLIFTIAFVTAWTIYELATALMHPLITWDGMVYWLNGQSYLQGRWPVYEFFRPPTLPLFLAFTQYLGLTIQTTVVWHPIVTGLSGFILFLILRGFVREWLASVGTMLYLATSVVELWSTSILTHGLGNLFLLSGIFFLTRTNPTFKKEILGAVFLTIAIYTRYPLAVVVIPFGVWYAVTRKRIVDLDALLVGGILPLVPAILSNPLSILDTAREIFGIEFLGQKSVFVASPSPLVTSPAFYLEWLIGNLQLLTVFLGIGIVAVLRARKSPTFVFAIWFIPYLVTFSFLSNRQDRFVFEIAPAIAALVVIGAEYSLRQFSRQRILAIFIVALAGFYAVNQTLAASSTVPVGFQLNDTALASTYQTVGNIISTHTQPNDIVVAENDAPWLSYYSSRYVYLSRTAQATNGQDLKNYLLSFNPNPNLLVATPFLGSNMTLLNSQTYLHLILTVNTPSWGQVYFYQATLGRVSEPRI
jgi:hypothetical protein